MSRLDDLFAPQPVPEWLQFFEGEPERAVDALLWRRFYFGPLNVEEPEDLLIDWALLLSEDEELLRQLDGALALWMERTWGEHPEGSARRLADAWSALFHVVKNVDGLPLTVDALRRAFEEKDEYLGALSVSPSQDPLGRYLDALAAHQEDRFLAPFWWRLCDLSEDTPFYHASYAMAGLIGLPPLKEEAGGFREEVARSTVSLARAFDRLVERRALPEKRAENAFRSIARLAMARFPFPEPWGQVFVREAPRTSERSARWLEKLLPGRFDSKQKRGAPPERQRFDFSGWKARAQRIAGELRRNIPSALQAAEELLAEEERYAEISGDSFNLVRSLTTFASSSWQTLPQRAVQWAEAARRWEPWNAYSWNTLVVALTEWNGAEAALPLAWATVERFPENPATRNGLAEVLKASDRLVEAEQVYRETIDKFPDDVVARNGLAEVLKTSDRLVEAEQVYRETVVKFPDNIHARNGLAEVLKASNRLVEAEQVYRETVVKFPDDVVARNGLAAVLRLQGPAFLDEALHIVNGVLEKQPRRKDSLTEKARILERMGRFEEATEAFEQGQEEPHRAEISFRENLPRNGAAASEPARNEREAFASRASGSTSGVEIYSLERSLPSEAREASSAYRLPIRRNRQDRALWTSEARFYRRWARQGGGAVGQDRRPEALRDRADKLLSQILSLWPHDARALAERALLRLDVGRWSEARDLILPALEEQPAAPALLAVLTRAEREGALARKKTLQEAQTEILGPSVCLRALNPVFQPLVHLQQGRAFVALTDGFDRLKGAAKELTHLRQWIRPFLGKTENTFEKWWGGRVEERIFFQLGPEPEVQPTDVETLEKTLAERASEVDLLEEDFWVRLSNSPAPVTGLSGEPSG